MRKLFVYLTLALVLSVILPGSALAQSGNFATGLLDKFVAQTDGWWGILRSYALYLFTLTLIIEVCLFGIRVALQQSNIAEILGQFVTLMLFAGFIAAVIMNYQEWATGIAIRGLRPLVGQLTANSVDAGSPVAMASALMEKIIPVMDDAGVFDFGEVYLFVSCMLIIMVVFVLISALVILTTCEFYIMANVGVLLIGLGGSKIFKDYAVNAMRYVLAVALKLFILQLIVNIGFAIISLTDLDSTVGSTLNSIKFVDLFFLIGKAIILLALAKTLPDTCAGIINGSAIGGGNPLSQMAHTAGTMAVAAVASGAGAAYGAAKGAKAAYTISKEEGAVGVGETLGGMARAARNAWTDARAGQAQKALESDPGSMKNQLISTANASVARRLMSENNGEAATSTSAPTTTPISEPVAAQTSASAVAGPPPQSTPPRSPVDQRSFTSKEGMTGEI
ncbi:MAG: P-type conjugative transfer protein TrbL [Candidatus Adiutrix sp.]|jgi:type IV secretion system protein TrbL|nr:P-type conjugative transfer protein TrbL [Candidatus Adiutrix sp.]